MDFNLRLLVVDDNESIHEDFKKVLSSHHQSHDQAVTDLEKELFDEAETKTGAVERMELPVYVVDHALQGQEALKKVIAADEEGKPYAMAFMDVRMPPGWDGIETIQRIWEKYPYIEMVLCTAYSDHSWNEIIARLGNTDKLLFIRKPFDATAVQQIALTLVKKWNLGWQARRYVEKLETEVASRTSQLQSVLTELERKNAQLQSSNEALEHAALHDPLTKLPNRALLHDRLYQCIESARRDHTGFAFAIIDVDKFKTVNDTYGHLAGDKVLQDVAERLVLQLRSSDTVARLGGDEFALIMPRADRAACVPIVKKITRVMQEPIMFNQQCLLVGCSVGITFYPEHGMDVASLMKHADAAMDQAKRSGTGFEIFDAVEHEKVTEQEQLMIDLSDAVHNGKLHLNYQPIVDIKSGVVYGLEALCRWNHPHMGFIPPDKFIAMAEQKGLIKPLTDWVINEALKQTALWHKKGFLVHIAVNLSVRNFLDPTLPDLIKVVMDKYDFSPTYLTLEITESMTMSDPERALKITNLYKGMGMQLSLDDFGTGYSSLSYLKRLPSRELKIDRDFILNLPNDAESRIIVKSTVDLAHNLGLKVVAEGVEDQATLELLAAMGCDRAQGYYICKPQVNAEIVKWLMDSKWSAKQQAG
ncbi:MAG: EAL domain-containing protein [Gammaproteobacteria bacterium]|nr:EAL domain-containing protein [Gammaproteobacteria bacterium]